MVKLKVENLNKEKNLINENNIKIKEINIDIIFNGVITKFYPIVIDIEISANLNIFLIGIYLPATNVHLCLCLNIKDDFNHFNYLKEQLNTFFKFFYINETNNPLLAGHNILYFDLPIIFCFLDIQTNTLKGLFKEINPFYFI